LGIVSQDHVAIVGGGSGHHPAAIAPQAFFAGRRRAISLLPIVAAQESEATIGIPFGLLLFMEVVGEKLARIVFFDPGVDVFDIDGDRFAQAGNLVAEGLDGAAQQQAQVLVAERLFRVPGTSRECRSKVGQEVLLTLKQGVCLF
jgi:hypothetical protein